MVATERLLLIPLNFAQEHDYLDDDGKLELSLGLIYVPRKLPPELKEVISRYILPLFVEQPEYHLFFTSWIAVEKSTSCIVADLAFKGRPNEKGATEIGYGTYELYRNKGFMTEAVRGMSNWAFKEAGLREITAETEKVNNASIRVLEKNGFQRRSDADGQLCWSRFR